MIPPRTRNKGALLALLLGLAALASAQHPAVPQAWRDDADGNRIADGIDAEIRRARRDAASPADAAAALREPIPVVLLFDRPVRGDNRRRVAHRGGTITAEESVLLHALHASVPRGEIAALAADLPDLVLVAEPEDFHARLVLFAGDGTPRSLPWRDSAELSRLIEEERAMPPGLLVLRPSARGMESATRRARIESLRATGLLVLPPWMDPAWEEALVASAPHPLWHRPGRARLVDPALVVTGTEDPAQLGALLDSLLVPVTDGMTLVAAPDRPWRLVTSTEAGWIVRHLPGALGEARVSTHPIGPEWSAERGAREAREEATLAPGAQARLGRPGAPVEEYFLLVEGGGHVDLLPWRDDSPVVVDVPPLERLFPQDPPEAESRLATEPITRDSVPVADRRIAIDGIAPAGIPPAVVNTSAPESPAFQVANIRVANDNDFLYLHVGAALPATSDSVPVALWIIHDADRPRGVNPLTDNGLRGPVAATAGLEGTVLEPFMEADGLFFLENATTARRDVYRLWWVHHAGEDHRLLAEMGMTTPGPAMNATGGPVGFLAGFNNTGNFSVPRDSGRVDTGLSLRIPLAMLGLEAPLYPLLRPQQVRLMVAGGHGETGAWSNQVLGPVTGPRVLGGGLGMPKPDFREKIAADGETPFSGTQAMEFTVRYAPRGGTP